MIEIIVISSFVLLGAYSFWFFFKAKTYHPLCLDELALMWKIHKQNTDCKASHIDTLLFKNNEVVGYKCKCGNKFLQKRLITKKAHTFTRTKLTPSLTNKFTGVLEIKRSVETAGLNCSHIKQL